MINTSSFYEKSFIDRNVRLESKRFIETLTIRGFLRVCTSHLQLIKNYYLFNWNAHIQCNSILRGPNIKVILIFQFEF